jgi:hypothetical protein
MTPAADQYCACILPDIWATGAELPCAIAGVTAAKVAAIARVTSFETDFILYVSGMPLAEIRCRPVLERISLNSKA